MYYVLFSYLLPYLLSTSASPTILNRDRLQATPDFTLDVVEGYTEVGISRREAEQRNAVVDGVSLPDKRVFSGMTLEHGWEVRYEYYNTFQLLPVDTVTHILSKFYGDVMLKVLDLADKKPVSYVILDHGSLRLEFYEAAGEGIPWNVIYRFANNLMTMTGMGFTSTYNAVYCHNPTGSSIVVKLSVLAPVAAAVVGLAAYGAKK